MTHRPSSRNPRTTSSGRGRQHQRPTPTPPPLSTPPSPAWHGKVNTVLMRSHTTPVGWADVLTAAVMFLTPLALKGWAELRHSLQGWTLESRPAHPDDPEEERWDDRFREWNEQNNDALEDEAFQRALARHENDPDGTDQAMGRDWDSDDRK